MRWCRSSQRFGLFMALFALWIQFAVSFTHIHSGHFVLHDASLSGLSTPAQSLTRPSADGGDNGLLADECPICASIYLASSALIEQPPPLNLAVSVNSLVGPFIGEFYFRICRYSFFVTRAPPVV
jgi:hypothetical protein